MTCYYCIWLESLRIPPFFASSLLPLPVQELCLFDPPPVAFCPTTSLGGVSPSGRSPAGRSPVEFRPLSFTGENGVLFRGR